MLKLLQKLTFQAPVKDALSAGVTIATQRNERAAENLRDVITELLEENDRLKGKGARQ
ncbi:hypothetical protein UFOVP131_28 [uncultured Caudovirales phage]|jgi:hypothetical protein|uniref:Uncharacterized protein n=1 Tax=uncultured Caudovirales phage TaxID=2100421 RepID=A0A6J5LFA3_9CAUD|nr:hypothetical protein UFOVP131_28 [uncultured Caudovirales phage]